MLPRLLAVTLPGIPIAAFLMASGLLQPEAAELPMPTTGHTARMISGLTPELDVVIIGNSQADSAVDHEALGQQLGIPGKVGVAALPGLHADGAYAILKYRVFGAGLHPKIVVLPMSLNHLLDTDPPADHNLKTLQENLPGSDPVLDAKEFGAAEASFASPRWTRAVGRLQAARDHALEVLTSVPVRLFSDGDPWERMDAARDAALGEVAGANLALQVRVMPAAGGGARSSAVGRVADSIEETLLPDIVQLAKDNGAQLVVATVPQKVQALGTRPELAREVAEWLQAQGVPFLHLERMEAPTDGWLDPGHLAKKGEVIYTGLLTAQLQQVGVLGDRDAMKMPALPIQPPKVTRTGDPPPPKVLGQTPNDSGCLVRVRVDAPRWRTDAFLGKIGMGYASLLAATSGGKELVPHVSVNDTTGCTGRMWHAFDTLAVAPWAAGQPIEVSWAGTPASRRGGPKEEHPLEQTVYWLPPGGTLQLDWSTPPEADHLAVALAEINPGKGAPQVAIAGQQTALTAWGKTWSAELDISNSGIRGPLTLTSPPGGPELFLKLIAVRKDGSTQLALGQLNDVPWRLEISGTMLMDASTPVPVKVVGTNPARLGRTLVFTIDGPLAAATNDALVRSVDDRRFSGCLPLAVRKVSDPNMEPKLTQQVNPGRVVSAIPPELGDDWELIWRDKRVCSRRAWVMPGEVVPIRPRLPGAVFVQTDELLLDLVAFPPAGNAHVRVLHGDKELLVTDVDLAGPRITTHALTSPMPPWPEGVWMEVTAPPESFVSVGLGELRPHERAAWFAIDSIDGGAPEPTEPDPTEP
jgi:hypothetical protein